MRIASIVCAGWLLASAGQAEAATCDFDEATGVLTVLTLGGAATLRVVVGAIELDDVACGAATTTSTSRVVIRGVDDDGDALTLAGRFAPGRNDMPEDDRPEIEIEVRRFNDAADSVIVSGSPRDEVWRFTAGGIDFNGDLDEDLDAPARGRIELRGRDGNDAIDATAYSGLCQLRLRGGAGDDSITGSAGDDDIDGDAGNDALEGGDGDDIVWDGSGSDSLGGGPGFDRFLGLSTVADGADDFRGGTGTDRVSYLLRQNPLVITIDDVADDGEPGEGDNVHTDVEELDGGDGNDVLVAFSGFHALGGSSGDDELYGGSGRNLLHGGPGNDILFGEAGNDQLYGGEGNDILDGGSNTDLMTGNGGDDVFFNADGVAETVDCGPGIDDPEPSAGDTFIGCENI